MSLFDKGRQLDLYKHALCIITIGSGSPCCTPALARPFSSRHTCNFCYVKKVRFGAVARIYSPQTTYREAGLEHVFLRARQRSIARKRQRHRE